jgi:hypothetical protein
MYFLLKIIQTICKLYIFFEQNEFEAYIEKRDENNKKVLLPLYNKEMALLQQHFLLEDIVLISSFGSNLNMLTGSDIDIGIMIDTAEPTAELLEKINSLGYTFDQIRNKNSKVSKYYSFLKDNSGIEFELKVMNRFNSKPLTDMHNSLDQKKSTFDTKINTYAKYKFAELKNLYKNNKGYHDFKTIVWMAELKNVAGDFEVWYY